MDILKGFIGNYPGHFFIKDAREKIAEIFFKEASGKNSSEAYTEFIKNYPDSVLVPKARAKIIDLAWENAKKKNTIEIYSEFQQKFPQSKYSVETQKKISILKDFEVARSEYTVSAFEKFIKEHSESELVEKARNKIKEINRSKKTVADFIKLCNDQDLKGSFSLFKSPEPFLEGGEYHGRGFVIVIAKKNKDKGALRDIYKKTRVDFSMPPKSGGYKSVSYANYSPFYIITVIKQKSVGEKIKKLSEALKNW